MEITEENILEESKKVNLEVLKSDLVCVVKDCNGSTPLHELSYRAKIEILDNEFVGVVKDDEGNTPLHYLACNGKHEVLKNDLVDVVKNLNDDTPLHLLAFSGKLKKKHLKEKYPWFKLKTGVEINEDLITEIINTPQSIRFILGE